MRGSVTSHRTPLLLVAHGTRSPAGPEVIEQIADAVSGRLQVEVRTAYVDVIGPTVAEAMHALDGPVVAIPAFLAAGYHVRTDLPEQIRATGREADVAVSAPLGPSRQIAEAMRQRLTECGWRPGDRILFSAAGSSDPRALADVRSAALLLGERCGQWLTPSYVTTAAPLTGELCARPQAAFVAPYLLAPGLFHRKLTELEVTAVAEPLGAHPLVVDLICGHYRRTCQDRVFAA